MTHIENDRHSRWYTNPTTHHPRPTHRCQWCPRRGVSATSMPLMYTVPRTLATLTFSCRCQWCMHRAEIFHPHQWCMFVRWSPRVCLSPRVCHNSNGRQMIRLHWRVFWDEFTDRYLRNKSFLFIVESRNALHHSCSSVVTVFPREQMARLSRNNHEGTQIKVNKSLHASEPQRTW